MLNIVRDMYRRVVASMQWIRTVDGMSFRKCARPLRMEIRLHASGRRV